MANRAIMRGMLYLAVFLFVLAVILFWLASRQQRSAGLPGGRVVYSDTSRWGAIEKPLYDPDIGLTGKPDYLVEQGLDTIPVEVKSTRAEAPYDSHIYQLAAYCLLTQTLTGRRPPYGLLQYANQVFAIDYTPELENALRDVVLEMQAHNTRKEQPRSHAAPRRCVRCGYRSVCNQRLDAH
jgi:CRISPR-associated exonuclease Cas4